MTFAALLESNDGLDLLFSGLLQQDRSSWAINFTATQEERDQNIRGRHDDIALALHCDPELCGGVMRAGGQSKRRIKRHQEALLIQGLNFDEVVLTARRSFGYGNVQISPEPTFSKQKSYSIWPRASQQQRLASQLKESAEKVSRQAYVVEIPPQRPQDLSLPQASIWNSYGRLRPTPAKPLIPWLGRNEDKTYSAACSNEFDRYAQAVLQDDNLFFVTRSGFVGLARHQVEMGDIVAVFFGCSLPAVLRHISTDHPDPTYSLVGGAYIPGIMRGEFVDKGVPGLVQKGVNSPRQFVVV